MNKQIDARGLSCPQPVIITKKALEEIKSGRITTIVDNEVARDNVTKLAKSLDCRVDIHEQNGEYYINIEKGHDISLEEPLMETDDTLIILISSDELGDGSERLGRILQKSFLYSLTEAEKLPKTLLFINGGVKLTTEGSDVIDSLKELQRRGVEILSCGTCLDYFNLKDKLLIGSITNMYTIVEKLTNAKKVITL
ncbi:MAG: hypothetical protein PWQ82_314 [Thermosediminibacterales bacterium]|nr:hypothetical protein [Thermosediminibacterales bacterium]MDK2836404.1 hypothetical protein [Thermosediminibacterales bacterium]